MNITLNVSGVEELKAAFNQVVEGIKDFRRGDVWGKVQRVFYKIENELFTSEGASGASGKWAPLSSPYAEIKAKKWGAVPILTASGRMWKAMSSETGDSVVDKQAQSMTIGTSLKYPGYHQAGTGRMAQRKVVDLTESQQADIVAPIILRAKQIADNAKLSKLRGL